MNQQKVVRVLSGHLAPCGFDLCAAFDVAAYNGAALPQHQLPTLGLAHPLGVVMGSSKALWEPFCDFVRHNPHFADEKDPLDKYTERVTAAHFSGVAYYDQDVMWCVHSVYGLWCSFRAVAVFRLPADPAAIPPPPPPLLSLAEKEAIVALTRRAMDEDWGNIHTLLEIRDQCVVGREHRYCQDQLDYHYVREYAQVLRERVLGLPPPPDPQHE